MTLLPNSLWGTRARVGNTAYIGGDTEVNGNPLPKVRANSPRAPRVCFPIAEAILHLENSSFGQVRQGYYLEMEDSNGRHNVMIDVQSKVIHHNDCQHSKVKDMNICSHMAQAVMLMAYVEKKGNVHDEPFWRDYQGNIVDLNNGSQVPDFEHLMVEVMETFFEMRLSTFSRAELSSLPTIQNDLSNDIFGRNGVFTMLNPQRKNTAQSGPQAAPSIPTGGFIPDGDDDDSSVPYTPPAYVPGNFPKKRDEVPAFLTKLIPDHSVAEYLQVDGEMDDIRDYIKESLETGKRPCLWLYGPPGTGKTFGGECIAGEYQAPLIKVNCHDEMLEEHLLGNIHRQEDGSHKWIDGPVPMALRTGSVLFFDEAHTIPTGLLTTLYPVTDGSKRIRIPYAPEEFQLVDVHPDTIVIASANEGAGYKTYKGKFDPAWRDRWFTIKVDYLPADQMAHLIARKTGFTDLKVLAKMCETAEILRTMYEDRELEYICSTRTVEDWARQAKIKPPIEAAKRPLLDKLCTNADQVLTVQNLLEQKFI